MGKFDAESKAYLNIKEIFADAFNYLIYDGEPIINPKALKPVDTTEIAAPYGNGARVSVQKYRDIMKVWAAMYDRRTVYVLFGGEIQSKVHYAMPVRNMLYDSINYSSQVEEARKSYRKKDREPDKDGEIILKDGEVKIRLTSEELMSGFRKGDKLIPVITAVIYLGDDDWNGPENLHEMLDIEDKRLLKLIPDHFINLIVPKRIKDEDFGNKFNTGFGFVLDILKHQKDDIDGILKRHTSVDRPSAVFVNQIANLGLVFEEPEEKGEVNMCLAMENYTKKERILAAIDAKQDSGETLEQIVEYIIKKYNVTKEYIEKLMKPVAS